MARLTFHKPPYCSFPGPCRRRSGFILLMSLVLLAVVGLLLAGVARHSVQLNVQAADAAQELQVRWGATTLRRTLARRAGMIHAQAMADCVAEQRTYVSPFPWHEKIELSGHEFSFSVDVEERKLNLNRLSAMRGSASAVEAISTLTTLTSAMVLRPTQITDAHFFGDGMLDSRGQVFDYTRLPEDETLARSLQPERERLTLWGSGRLALHDVQLSVLQVACGNRVSAATLAKFEELRQDTTLSVRDVLEGVKGTDSERRELERWLTDELTTYLVSTDVEGVAPPYRQFAIVQQGRITRHQFAW